MIESSVYRTVYHPLYFGTTLWAVGEKLIIQSVPTAIVGIVAFFCLQMASRKEDEFDIEKFRDGHRDYTKKVPKWNFLRGLRRLW